MASKTAEKGKGGLELTEEAIRTLRFAPLEAIACYYIGTAPFVCGLLTYWATMSRSATAPEAHALGALGVAFLFVWMKAWQTRFATVLRAHIVGASAPPKWGVRGFVRCSGRQALLQASGFIFLPVSAVFILPYGWTHAFYQNLCVLDEGREESMRELVKDAMRQASFWQRQNSILIWLLSPLFLFLITAVFLAILPVFEQIMPEWLLGFAYLYVVLLCMAFAVFSPIAVLIFINTGGLIAFGSMLLKTYMGIETIFSLAPDAMLNSTFFAFLCGFTFLVMDPVLKTAYVLRCFYSKSTHTGDDIRIKIRRIATMAVLLAVGTMYIVGVVLIPEVGQVVYAAETLDSSNLDKSLNEVMDRRHFQWRMPRDLYKDKELNLSWLEGIVNWISEMLSGVLDWVGRVLRWIFDRDLFSGATGDGISASLLSSIVKTLLVLLIGVLAGILAVLLLRYLKKRASQPSTPELSLLIETPDLEDDATTADALPEQDWLSLAATLTAEGKLRLAARALFFATLARLAHHELIRVARYKSNLEYAGELQRFAHVYPTAPEVFRENIGLYEAVWYGDHPATQECLARLQLNQSALRVHGHE